MIECLRVETDVAQPANELLPAGVAAHQNDHVRLVVLGPSQPRSRSSGTGLPCSRFRSCNWVGLAGRRSPAATAPAAPCRTGDGRAAPRRCTPAPPVDGLYPVQRLGGVGDGVVEIRQNLRPPVLHGGRESLEVRLQAGWDGPWKASKAATACALGRS